RDWLVEGAGRDAALAERLDHELCRRRSSEFVRDDQGEAAVIGGDGDGGGGGGQSGLLHLELLPAATLPAGGPDGVAAPGFQASQRVIGAVGGGNAIDKKGKPAFEPKHNGLSR